MNVAICSEPAYEVCLSYGVNAATMLTATCFLHTGADISLVNPTLLHQKRTNRIKLEKMSHLREAAREPFRMEGTILLHACLDELCMRQSMNWHRL